MSISSDSAEQLMKLCLDETEFVLRLSGVGIKNIATALYVISKDQKASKGKTRLSNMLKSNKESKIFSIKRSDLKIFAREAKAYGVLYCALMSKDKNVDDMVDLMVRADDAPKVNRIIERFGLTTVDKAIVRKESEQEQGKENQDKDVGENAPDKEVQKKDIDETMIDDMFDFPTKKEEERNLNLEEAQTEKSPPLELSSTSKTENFEGVTKSVERKSVKKELQELYEQKKLDTELKKAQQDKGVIIENQTSNIPKVNLEVKKENKGR